MPRKSEPTACLQAMKHYVEKLEFVLREASDKHYAIQHQLDGARGMLDTYLRELERAKKIRKQSPVRSRAPKVDLTLERLKLSENEKAGLSPVENQPI